MRSYCPLGRMSCIGRYRRNVLTLKQTMAWVLLWCFSGIADICLQHLFISYKEEWTSETIFWIWNIKGAATNEVLHILIPFALSVPTDEGSSSVGFYIKKSSILVPRRPDEQEQALWKPSKRIFVQQYVNGQQKMKTEENANLLKEPYEELPRKEIRLVDKEDEEIVLSIPNLRQKRDFPCILYCKVHQASRVVKWNSYMHKCTCFVE